MIENKPFLKLSDADGNVFFIIARARRIAKKAGWPEAKIDEFTKEAERGNYDHAIKTCIEYFEVY